MGDVDKCKLPSTNVCTNISNQTISLKRAKYTRAKSNIFSKFEPIYVNQCLSLPWEHAIQLTVLHATIKKSLVTSNSQQAIFNRPFRHSRYCYTSSSPPCSWGLSRSLERILGELIGFDWLKGCQTGPYDYLWLSP